PWTYEPYPPELVGNTRRITIGKHSGKNVIKYKIKEVTGKDINEDKLMEVVSRVKEIYANGRKASLREEEFKAILKELNIL
ncbi:MAG: hypothetical protein QXY51_01410, partial [Candidatus Bathyarchaeia archaeon]